MQADALFASVLVLCLLGIAMFLCMKGLEARLIPWHAAKKETEKDE
jgi:ABC-type nitrate/sulfonate/bicarbonate transport system permease component